MANTNDISVYYGNTLDVTCTVTGIDDISNFTVTMTVTDRLGVEQFTNTGTTNGLTALFTITPSENTIPVDNYTYSITLEGDSSDGRVFTVAKAKYEVKKRNP